MVVRDFDDAEDRQRGSIVRIRLQNFMTYDDEEIKPGSRLNMVLGPNGTGKSTIVCCIIVGLAGEVSLTGRGGSPADFVKKNTDYAITEIELFNDHGSNYIIERKIIITHRSPIKIEHKSEWKINGKLVNKSGVQALTKKLNIKVDNLCQFLPQDCVTQFVKMNTCELLLNTLKAAGDNELVEDHQKLVEFTKEIDGKRTQLKELERSCKENEVNAQRLESEVNQLRERDKLIKLKNICGQKIHYARYLEAQEHCRNAAEERDKIRESLREVESLSEPYKKSAELFKNDESKYRQSIESSGSNLNKLNKQISDVQTGIEDSKYKCQELFSNFTTKLEEEKDRETNLKLKHQELKNYQDKYDEAIEVDCARDIQELESRISSIKSERLKINREITGIEDIRTRLTRDLCQLKTEAQLVHEIKTKKSQILKSKNHDSFKIMDWLSTNRDKFEKHVFTPIMCEINVKNPKYNSIIEHAIQRNELTAFVCQTENDVKTLTRLVREELRLKINVILAPEKTIEEFASETARVPNLPELGEKIFLKDLIDVAEPIMRYLCGSNNFHRIFVVDNCPESKLKVLMDKYPRFYANEEFFSSTKSRYDSQMIILRDAVRPANHLIYSWDAQSFNEQKVKYNQLSSQIKGHEDDKKKLEDKDSELKNEWQAKVEKHRELKYKHDEKKRLAVLIEKCKESLNQLENRRIDIETLRRKLHSSIEVINLEIMTKLEKLANLYSELVDSKKMNMLNLLLLRAAERNHKIARKRYQNSLRETNRLQENLKKATSALSTHKVSLESLRGIAEEKIPCLKDNDGRLDKSTKRRFDSVPETTVEELTLKREDLTIRIQRIFKDASNSVLSEFNKQNEELRDKRSRIEDLRNSIKTIDKSRESIKENWLPKLNDVIDCIDKNYRKFMRSLKYDGQVKLDYSSDDIDNFSSYGILILVKYRDNEQLIPLSATRQSGGERSVATMIYMLALQTKTTAPFRCVDEINQGMDKDNERKVFELLVQTADSSSSQYFLVSPKLLPNLPYSDKMKIHIIFNGPKMHLTWSDIMDAA